MHCANLLTDRARLTPHREAVFELATGTHYTFADLNARANRAANLLRSLGVQAGDRVSILAHNSIVYLDIFFAVGKIGAIFSPLNWRLTPAELAYIVNDNQPTVLFCGVEFADTLAAMRPGTNLRHIIALEGAKIDGARDYTSATNAVSVEEPPRPANLTAESPYCILYTSGTTGKPKGAVIPHRQVLWNILNTTASWGLTERDISPVFTPLFHAGGLFAFLTPILYLGGKIILGRTFNPAETLRIILEERCTVILGVPTLFQMWLNAPNFDDLDFSHVHFFISGGAPCPISLMDEWRNRKGVVFRQGYGLTEVGPNCFSMTDEESFLKAGSVGKPIFHSRMRLVDEQGNDVPVGETGELLIRGQHVCTGYWRNAEATAAALVDGWFHTGDMARMDADGFFYIAGRFKDMIISGGENVYAAEVEAVFHEHPAVADAALIGKPDEKWGEIGVMIVVREKGQTVSAAELTGFCRARLARFKVPKEIIFADELPHSPYGKVEKVKLQQRYLT